MMKWILALALVSLLVLASCPQDEKKMSCDPFVGGNTGLNMYYLDGMPPALIYDNGELPFSVGLIIDNTGEADVGPGTENPFVEVTLTGINPIQFSITEDDLVKSLTQPLRGSKMQFDCQHTGGDASQVSFEGLNYLPDLFGPSPLIVRSSLCYDYTTYSTTPICIKEDVVETVNDAAICTSRGEKIPKNSGAPVHITSLVQNPLSNKRIQIVFQIEHVGNGQIFARADGERCDYGVRNIQNKNVVDVFVRPLDDPNYVISCPRFEGSNQGSVVLLNGAPTQVTCTIENVGTANIPVFQDWIDIELRYRYGQFIDQPITIYDTGSR